MRHEAALVGSRGSLLIVASLAIGASAQGSYTMGGRVEGLQGNDHALVSAEGPIRAQATTRVEGVWQIDELPPGRYRVTPHHGRYAFTPKHLDVTIGDTGMDGVVFLATLRVEERGAECPRSSPRPARPTLTGSAGEWR